MSEEISLLPEEQRKKELNIKEQAPVAAPAELKFSTPVQEGEDIEVIEVDEGEIDQVLAGEPLLTRLAYKFTTTLEDLKAKFFQPQPEELPPKLPPQFFKPPVEKPIVPGVPGAAPVPGAPAVAGAPLMAKPGAPAVPAVGQPLVRRTMPVSAAQRRVRVIKRVRKPVRVSFVSEEELRAQHIDIPRRKFTFAIATALCVVLLVGGYYLLTSQVDAAASNLAQAQAQVAQVQKETADKQKTWAQFQNLEPRLRTLSSLLDHHSSPDHVLKLIEDSTLPTVVYTSFSLTADRTVTLNVVADSLETAAEQAVVLQSAPFVQKANIGGYSIQYGSDPFVPKAVTFQASLLLNEDAVKAVPPQVAAGQ